MTSKAIKKVYLTPAGPDTPSLFVIPRSTHLAYVWCPLPAGDAIAEIRVAGTTASVLGRKKLFQPGHSFEVLLIEAVNLRDGAWCELVLGDRNGGFRSVDLHASLARWDNPDTSRVLKFIAKRFDADDEPPHVLERYLAFTSVWQAPARVVDSFPEGQIVEISIRCDDAEVDAYAVTPQGLRSIALKPLLVSAEQRTVWFHGAASDVIYLEVSGELVRIRLQEAGRTSPPSHRSFAPVAKVELIESLHNLAEQPSPELHQWISRLCEPQIIIRADDVSVEVVGALRLPSEEIAFFINVHGNAGGLTDLQVQSFRGHADPDCVVLARDTGALRDDEVQTQIILTAASPSSRATCHRLQWTHNGETFSAWVRETDPQNARVYTIVRDFSPVTAVHEDTFSTVLHPLATSERGVSASPPTHRTILRSGSRAAQADIFVFVGADLEALHRTLIGLSLTSRDIPFDVNLCLLDQGVMTKLAREAETWAGLYDVPLRLLCYSSRASEADVVENVLQGDIPRVFCRAGVVPRQGDWLPVLLNKLKTERDTILLAASGHPVPRRKARVPSDAFERLLHDTLKQGAATALRAAVVAPGYHPDLGGAPRLFTMEAVLLRLALQTTGLAGSSLPVAPELAFAHSGTNCRPDPFQAELDIYSLQEQRKSSLGSECRRIKF